MSIQQADGGDAVVFQHDGDSPLREQDVEGLSKLFRSTKGAASVGFMGVGFKSVFGRFLEARVSGWEWSFRFETVMEVGDEYGDVQRDLLGAVIPIWDDGVEPPACAFTTRFELRRRVRKDVEVAADFDRFVSRDKPELLPILAQSGLTSLALDGDLWTLGLESGPRDTQRATASIGGAVRCWQLFPVEFSPSREAIRAFLEHRRLRPTPAEREHVYQEAAQPRTVIGILPLDESGRAAPVNNGLAYATLPTKVTLALGIHIQADWLVNLSRTGFRELENNPWQREIVDRIADVIARVLRWIAGTSGDAEGAKRAFGALRLPPPENRSGLDSLLAKESWLERLRNQIGDAPVLPVWTDKEDALKWDRPSAVVDPPYALCAAFKQHPSLRASAAEGAGAALRPAGRRRMEATDGVRSPAGDAARRSPLPMEKRPPILVGDVAPKSQRTPRAAVLRLGRCGGAALRVGSRAPALYSGGFRRLVTVGPVAHRGGHAAIT